MMPPDESVGGSNLANAFQVPDPVLAPLHELLEAGASLNEIDIEVRRLIIMAFVVGNERGIAYVIGMDKSDEAIDQVGEEDVKAKS